ncbi:MAG: CHAD domain-containing protein, partial [Bdellovibrionota bacterium]
MPDSNQSLIAEPNKMAKASLTEQIENTNHIRRHLRGQMREFEILLDKVAAHPTADPVHNLRVVSRKIRTILWLMKRDQQIPARRSLNRRLRELGRLLGKVRELDVTREILPHFHTNDPELQRHRKQSALEIQNYLKPKLRLHLKADLNRVARSLDTIPVLHAEKSFGKLSKFARSWESGPGKGRRALHK